MFGKALAAFGERTDVHADSLPVAAAQTPTAAEPTGAMWNCGKCSNVNNAGASKCNLCASPRQAQAKSNQIIQQQEQKQQPLPMVQMPEQGHNNPMQMQQMQQMQTQMQQMQQMQMQMQPQNTPASHPTGCRCGWKCRLFFSLVVIAVIILFASSPGIFSGSPTSSPSCCAKRGGGTYDRFCEALGSIGCEAVPVECRWSSSCQSSSSCCAAGGKRTYDTICKALGTSSTCTALELNRFVGSTCTWSSSCQ